MPRRRKREAVESREARGREQAQRIPATAPLVADSLAAVKDDERHAACLQVVADRESRLSGADDDRVDAFAVHGLLLDMNVRHGAAHAHRPEYADGSIE